MKVYNQIGTVKRAPLSQLPVCRQYPSAELLGSKWQGRVYGILTFGADTFDVRSGLVRKIIDISA